MVTVRRELWVVRWVREHPFTSDALLALGVAALSLPGPWITRVGVHYRSPDAWDVLLVLASSLPLAFRRRAPVTVFAGILTAAVTQAAAGYNSSLGGLDVLVALYTVAAHRARFPALAAGVLSAIGVLIVLTTAPEKVELTDVVSTYVVFAAGWVLGGNMRLRRAYVAELEERAERVEREREAEAGRAMARERGRIARELHDVVAHNVSVMVVQAGGARRVLDRGSGGHEQAREALSSIETTGRQALAEMRRLLGVLRSDDDPTDGLVPQPGVGALDGLLDQVREAGLPVDLRVEGDVRPLESGVDLSAYRIVQEALTNALKHAGPAQAQVVLRYGVEDMVVEVTDDGRGGATGVAGSNGRGGHGLLGMQERVALFGGELRTGPRPGGGYAVRARLPFAAAGNGS